MSSFIPNNKIIIFVLVVVLLNIILLYNFTDKFVGSINYDFFDIIYMDNLTNNDDYLISYDGHKYYLKNHKVDKTYIVINENGNPITQEIIETAKNHLEESKYIYDYYNDKIKIYPIRIALYENIINVNWLTDNIVYKKSSFKSSISFNLEKNTNVDFITIYDFTGLAQLKIKGINFCNLILNNENFDSLEELFVNSEYSIDELIEFIKNNYVLLLDTNESLYTNSNLLIFENNGFNFGLEYEYNNDNIVYYLYYIEK